MSTVFFLRFIVFNLPRCDHSDVC